MKNRPSVICFGEVLWDVFPTGKKAGGAPMNVAVNLKKLGIDSSFISRIGNDEFGLELNNFVKVNKINSFIQVDKLHNTGMVKVNVANNQEVNYDIVFPAAWDFIEFNEDIKEIVAKADYVVFGSLACRNSSTYTTLSKILEQARYKVFDINLRYPHYKREIIEELLFKADMVKVNKEELMVLNKWNDVLGGTLDVICKKIKENYKIDQLIVTLGENGAIVSYGSEIFKHPGFKIDVEDTVGSGDAFLAAFLANQIKGRDIKTSLDFACATGAYLASKNGANPQYDESQIIKFIKRQTYGGVTTNLTLPS